MKKLIIILILPLLPLVTTGNGLEITNLSVNDTYTQATFDISWENSWRQTERFHDAVWVYIKYKPDNSVQWLHTKISGGTASGNLELISQNDQLGIFVRPASDFTGNVAPTTVTVDIEVDPEIAILPDFEVYGIEMVYIPEGAFFVGDGNGNSLSVKSSGEYGLDESAPYLFYEFGKDYLKTNIYDSLPLVYDKSDGTIGLTNSGYPTGFQAFYCMKYPFSQGQVVDFLNRMGLAASEALQLSPKDLAKNTFLMVGGRNGIFITDSIMPNGTMSMVNDLGDNGNYNETNDGATLANFFNMDKKSDTLDVELFYQLLSWTGLRPMTELEFEKVCRGPLPPAPGEFAWGSTGVTVPDLFLLNPGTETEFISMPGLSRIDITSSLDSNGPFRVGFLAGSGFNRLQSHAGYYGVLDLSNNGNPFLISVTHIDFKGENGTGSSSKRPKDWGTLSEVITRNKVVSQRIYLDDTFPIGEVRTMTGRGVRQP